ncbi:MAG: 3-isopropylmalate dehydratase [Candidatus Syntrophoarchaeum caldarius]|uniref:3-isopropylmalate dehydratase n=1 Tax=Candidatus Syntropharchaeum caldarium TaxID=1838285 RepID=A0A1F2PAE1_9EURY|nr:MAG: 3-isopropylmalate dehydratase [Candidatus Syntrophoarchaeum caldarius]
MKDVEVVTIKSIELKNPILIEGLPGVGHVGKLVAEYLIEELEAQKILEIYSPHFPPQVVVNPDGCVRMVKNEIFAYTSDDVELLILIGDHQSNTNEGHYLLTETFIDIAKQYNVKRIYTLGGYGIGQLVENPRVIGAVNDISLVEEMKSYGVEFSENEPGGGIIGVSGLMLAFGAMHGIEAVCLMGVTSGYLVDPRSAQAVLRILREILGIEIDMDALEKRGKEMETIVARLKEMEQMQGETEPGTTIAPEDALDYIR